MSSARAVAAVIAALALACTKAPAKSGSSDSPTAVRAHTTPVNVGGTPPTSGARAIKPSARSATPRRDTNRFDANPRRVDNPCGGVHVNVIVRVEALGGVTDMMSVQVALRNVAKDLLAPLSSSVVAGSEQISPAIRAFRVAVRGNRATADQVVSRLRSAREVESAEIDECAVRAH